MTVPRDFKKQPLTAGEWGIRLIATDVYESMLTPDQMALLVRIGKSAVIDSLATTLTLTIPADANEKDLQTVLPVFDLMMGPDLKILLVREMPRDHDLVAKVDKAALRRFATENDMLGSLSVKRMLGEATEDGRKRSRMAEADNQVLYNKLKKHFQKAAVKHPQYTDTFNVELDTYKKVLIDGDTASMEVLAGKFSAMAGEPVSQPEVERVLKGAMTIFAGKP